MTKVDVYCEPYLKSPAFTTLWKSDLTGENFCLSIKETIVAILIVFLLSLFLYLKHFARRPRPRKRKATPSKPPKGPKLPQHRTQPVRMSATSGDLTFNITIIHAVDQCNAGSLEHSGSLSQDNRVFYSNSYTIVDASEINRKSNSLIHLNLLVSKPD